MAVAIMLGAPHAQAARHAVIVFDPYAERTIYDSRAHTPIYPASLAKMMTIYIVFEELKAGRLAPHTLMTSSARALHVPPSKLNLIRGEKISVRAGIKALIIKSANDVAVVFAEHIAGSEWSFAKRMNQTAQKLGMHSTYFVNASGLPDRRQVSTAHDLMLLSRALLYEFPEQGFYWQLQNFAYGGKFYETHNRLLFNLPGALGLKTGFIQAAGYHAATVVERAGRSLILVAIGYDTPRVRDLHVRELTERYLPSATPDPRLMLTPRRTTRKPIATTRKWSIELGAFPTVQDALDQITRALQLLAPDLNAAHPTTTTHRKQNRVYYRPRLTNLEETRARQSCRKLASYDIPCLTVAPPRSHLRLGAPAPR